MFSISSSLIMFSLAFVRLVVSTCLAMAKLSPSLSRFVDPCTIRGRCYIVSVSSDALVIAGVALP